MIFISADKLLDEMELNVYLQCDYDEIKHLIDNLEPKLYVNDDFLKNHIANFTTRPQGKWNYIQVGMCVCPFCGAYPHKDYKNFCANCGAYMRGKEE